MKTVEFETCINNGLMQIPLIYRDWYDQTVRVILLKREIGDELQQENVWDEVHLLHLRLKQKHDQFSDSTSLIREQRDQ